MHKLTVITILLLMVLSSFIMFIPNEASALGSTYMVYDSFDDNHNNWTLHNGVTIADGRLGINDIYNGTSDQGYGQLNFDYALYIYEIEVDIYFNRSGIDDYDFFRIYLGDDLLQLHDGLYGCDWAFEVNGVTNSYSKEDNNAKGKWTLYHSRYFRNSTGFGYTTQLWFGEDNVYTGYHNIYINECLNYPTFIRFEWEGMTRTEYGNMNIDELSILSRISEDYELLNEPDNGVEGIEWEYVPSYTFAYDYINITTNFGISANESGYVSLTWPSPIEGNYWVNLKTYIDDVIITNDTFNITVISYMEFLGFTKVHSFFGNSTGVDPWIQMHYLFGNSTGVEPWTEMHNAIFSNKGIYVPSGMGENTSITLNSYIWMLLFFIPVIIMGLFAGLTGVSIGTIIMSIAGAVIFPSGMFILFIGVTVGVLMLFTRRNY